MIVKSPGWHLFKDAWSNLSISAIHRIYAHLVTDTHQALKQINNIQHFLSAYVNKVSCRHRVHLMQIITIMKTHLSVYFHTIWTSKQLYIHWWCVLKTSQKPAACKQMLRASHARGPHVLPARARVIDTLAGTSVISSRSTVVAAAPLSVQEVVRFKPVVRAGKVSVRNGMSVFASVEKLSTIATSKNAVNATRWARLRAHVSIVKATGRTSYETKRQSRPGHHRKVSLTVSHFKMSYEGLKSELTGKKRFYFGHWEWETGAAGDSSPRAGDSGFHPIPQDERTRFSSDWYEIRWCQKQVLSFLLHWHYK